MSVFTNILLILLIMFLITGLYFVVLEDSAFLSSPNTSGSVTYVPGIASIQNKASKRLYNKNAPLSLENQSTEALQQQFRRMRLMQVRFFFKKNVDMKNTT